MTTERIDVLAVLDLAASMHRRENRMACAKDADSAFAAVAELIEQNRQLADRLRAACNVMGQADGGLRFAAMPGARRLKRFETAIATDRKALMRQVELAVELLTKMGAPLPHLPRQSAGGAA